jgi:hypothetical protein
MANYSVVLFKDKKKKKIIKEYKTLAKAQEFFNSNISKSEKIIFEKVFESGKLCEFELAIIEKTKSQMSPTYLTDQFGRNKKVKLEDENLKFIKISKIKKEEEIYDIKKSIKISFDKFIKTYMVGNEMKMLYSLNNKIVLQENLEFKIFSVKNKSDAERFLDCVSKFYYDNKKTNCLFIKDSSVAQRKYLLKLLSDAGFDKKILYRQSTTHPR